MIIDSEYLSLHHKLFTRRNQHFFHFLNGQVLNYYFILKEAPISEQNQNSKFEIKKVIFKLLSIKIVKNYRYYLITIPILFLSNTYDHLNYQSNFKKSTEYVKINFKKGNNFSIERFKPLLKKNFKIYYLFHNANINLPFRLFRLGEAKSANSKRVLVKTVSKKLIHEISCKAFPERKKKIQGSPFNFFKGEPTFGNCLTAAISLFNPIYSENSNDTSLIYIRQMKKFRFGIIFLAYANKKKQKNNLIQRALDLYLSIFRIYFMRKKKNKLNAIFMAWPSKQLLNIILATLISNYRNLPYAESLNATNKKKNKNLTTNFLLSEPQQRVLLINIFTYVYFSSDNSLIYQIKYHQFIAKPLITKIPLTFHYLLNDNNFFKESPERKQLFMAELPWPRQFRHKNFAGKKDSKRILFNSNIPCFYNQNEDIFININFNIYKIVNTIVTLPVLKEFNNDLAYTIDHYFKNNDFILNLIQKCGNIPCSILLIYINMHYRFLKQDLSFFYLNKFFLLMAELPWPRNCLGQERLQNNKKDTNENSIVSFLNYFINIKFNQFIYCKQIILLYGSKKILAEKKVEAPYGTSALNKIYPIKQYKKNTLLLNIYLWDLNKSFFEKQILILKYLNFLWRNCLGQVLGRGSSSIKKNKFIENKRLYCLKNIHTIFFIAYAKKKIYSLKMEEKNISRGLSYQGSICSEIKVNNFQIKNRQRNIKKKFISFLPLELKINNMWRSDYDYNYNYNQYFSIKRLICFSILGQGSSAIKKFSRISFSYLLYSIKMSSNFLIEIGTRIMQEKNKPLFEVELKTKNKIKSNFFKVFLSKANLVRVNLKSSLRWYINLIDYSFLYKKKIKTFLWHSNKKLHNQNALNWIFKKFWFIIYFYTHKNKINSNRLNINLFLCRNCLGQVRKKNNSSYNTLKYRKCYSSNNWIPALNKGFDYMIEKKILKLVDIITLNKMSNFRAKYYKQDCKKIKKLFFIYGQGVSAKKLPWPSAQKNNQQIKITTILFFKNALTIGSYSTVNLLKNKDSYCLDKAAPERKKKLNTYFLYL
jgi:hypothetical protein